MAAITWDPEVGRTYYNGIDQVALYIKETNGTHSYSAPVAWDGVTALNENPSGAESTKLYADNKEYLNLQSKEEFGATLEAYQSPEEFDKCDGMDTLTGANDVYFGNVHGQSRESFGLSYRVLLGDGDNQPDPDKVTLNCEYHLIYGCRAGVASVDHPTINESPEANTFSWELTTTPQILTTLLAAGFVPTAHVIIKANEITGANETTKKAILAKITDVLHGTAEADGYLPTPEELLTLSLT